MPLACTVLHCIPDPETPGAQRVAVEIDGVRCTFAGAPAEVRRPEDVVAWLRARHGDAALAALAEARAAVEAAAPPPAYFLVREGDLTGPLLPVALRALLRRLNAVEAAANISPTTLDHLLEACRGEWPAAAPAPERQPAPARAAR